MIVQFNTDSNMQGNRELMQQIKAEVENSLERFGGKITRVVSQPWPRLWGVFVGSGGRIMSC